MYLNYLNMTLGLMFRISNIVKNQLTQQRKKNAPIFGTCKSNNFFQKFDYHTISGGLKKYHKIQNK